MQTIINVTAIPAQFKSGKSIDKLCKKYGLTREQVESEIRYAMKMFDAGRKK